LPIGLERLVELWRAHVLVKWRQCSETGIWKQDELKRSAMRAFLALLAIPDAGIYLYINYYLIYIKIIFIVFRQKYINDWLFVTIKSTQELSALYETIQKDSAVSNDVPMECNWVLIKFWFFDIINKLIFVKKYFKSFLLTTQKCFVT